MRRIARKGYQHPAELDEMSRMYYRYLGYKHFALTTDGTVDQSIEFFLPILSANQTKNKLPTSPPRQRVEATLPWSRGVSGPVSKGLSGPPNSRKLDDGQPQ